MSKIDKPLLVFGESYKNKQFGHAFIDETVPTIIANSGASRVFMPDGRVLEATPKLLARIMGLPDDVKLPKSLERARTVIGNGIPAQLTRSVMGTVVDQLKTENTERLSSGESIRYSITGGQGLNANEGDLDLRPGVGIELTRVKYDERERHTLWRALANKTANMRPGEVRIVGVFTVNKNNRSKFWLIAADGYNKGEVIECSIVNNKTKAYIAAVYEEVIYGRDDRVSAVDNSVPENDGRNFGDSAGGSNMPKDGRAIAPVYEDDGYESQIFEEYDLVEQEPGIYELRDKDTGEFRGFYGGSEIEDNRKASLTSDTAAADEFAVFDSYDDFDARHGKFKTAREATNALIDERIAKYGRIGETGKNNAREPRVPRQMKPGTKVSKAVETIYASGITPDFRIDDINDAVVAGAADYVSVSNKTLERRAKAKVRNIGFDRAKEQFLEASKAGKVNDDIVALGAVLLNEAGNSKECSGSDYIDILQAVVNVSHRSAVALQAQRLLKQLTPSGKLYALQQEVNKLNESRKPKPDPRGITATDNKHVEWWMEDTGKLLSQDVLARVKSLSGVGEERVKTVCQTVLEDLEYFARNDLPKVNKTVAKRSVMDRLRDLAANSEQYGEAWEQAKEYLMLKLDLSDADASAAVSTLMEDSLRVSDKLLAELSVGNDIKIDEDLAREFLAAETAEEQDAILDEMAQKIAEQIPATFREKINAFRYLAMLGNFKTQIRNVVGNAGFKRVRQVKDMVAGALESMFSKGDRTTSAFRDHATLTDESALAACAEDMKYIMAGGTKYEYKSETDQFRSELSSKIQDKRRIFNNGLLENWRTVTDSAMSEGFTVNIGGKDRTFFGDEKFCKFSYMDSLARTMKANGTTWAEASESLRSEARDRAILEAAKATYRDNNQFAQAISAIRFRNPDTTAKKFINFLGEGIVPFRKTPANILVRAVEYSPLNLVNSTTKAVLLKLGKNVDTEGNVKFTQTDVINSYAETITGSAIMAIGFALGAGLVKGLKLHGKQDDEDPLDAFNNMQGIQEYSIEFDGHTYTLDWLAPECIPLFLGANLAQASLDGGLTLQDAIDALMSITDPMLEMSMLQGINDAFQNAASYADDAALPNFVSNALWSLVSQFAPTILGQAERAFDNTRRSTYVNPDSAVPASWQKALGKLSAKVPFIDYDQIAYTDAWGRTQNLQDTALGNALYQFISPWYSTTIRESDMERELERLYESTGNGKILMTTAGKKLTVLVNPEDENSDTTEKQLTKAEYYTYNTTRGQTAYNAITAFTESEEYKTLTDEQRANVIEKLISFADTTGRINATPYSYTNEAGELIETSLVKVSQDYQKARKAMDAGLTAYQYYLAKEVGADCEYLIDSNGDKISNSKDLYQLQAIYNAFPNASKEEYSALFDAAGISKSIRGYNASMVNSKVSAMERYGSLSVLGATGIDSVDSELNRLAEADLGTNVLMGATGEKFKVSSDPNSKYASNDTDVKLTPEQYEQFDTYRRETGGQMLNTLISSSQYARLTDEQKAKAINKLESYINSTGKKLVMDSYITDSTVNNVAAAQKVGISESTYFSAWAVKNTTDSALYDKKGNTVPGSSGLYQMKAIYSALPGLTQQQYTNLFGYLGIAKSVRGLSPSEVSQKLAKMEGKYSKIRK